MMLCNSFSNAMYCSASNCDIFDSRLRLSPQSHGSSLTDGRTSFCVVSGDITFSSGAPNAALSLTIFIWPSAQPLFFFFVIYNIKIETLTFMAVVTLLQYLQVVIGQCAFDNVRCKISIWYFGRFPLNALQNKIDEKMRRWCLLKCRGGRSCQQLTIS